MPGVSILLLNLEEETNPRSKRATVLSEISHSGRVFKVYSEYSNSAIFIKTLHLGLRRIHGEPPSWTPTAKPLNLSPAPYSLPTYPFFLFYFYPFFHFRLVFTQCWTNVSKISERRDRQRWEKKNEYHYFSLWLSQLIKSCNQRHFSALVPAFQSLASSCHLALKGWHRL